jgi:CheY-like chemotaxis protein
MVDDNRSGLAARKAVLEELGHRVITAGCADDALEQFSKSRFDLVVTDHRISKLNGIELIRRIRAAQTPVKIIMLSSCVETLGLTEVNTGADVVVVKSANEITHLVRAVARLLRPGSKRKPPASHRAPAMAKRQSS